MLATTAMTETMAVLTVSALPTEAALQTLGLFLWFWFLFFNP